MKILLINNLHRKRGGADVVYFNTAELLRNAGHEVFFFSITTSDMEDCSESVFFAPSQENEFILQRICSYCYNKRAAVNLQKLIDKIHPDLAHIHLIWGGLSPSILVVLKKNNIPIIHSVHDYRMICPAYIFRTPDGKVCENCKGGKYYNCLRNRCSKGKLAESALMTYEMYLRDKKYNPCTLIDGFVFVSKFSRDKHIEHNPQFATIPSIVLYNFWNGTDIINEDEENNYNSYYLFYGRLSREKGLKTLIQAFEHNPSLKLWIIGDGPLKAELDTYCKKKCLDNIVFKGFMSGMTLFEAVHKAKFVCVPSEWYENNPMTIVESYALQTPVIGARIGGIPEIIDEKKTGFIFNPGDSEALEFAINQAEALSPSGYYRMRLCARAFANTNFSKDGHLKALIEFYRTVIDNYKR